MMPLILTRGLYMLDLYCFTKDISKFPDFSLQGIFFTKFPVFPDFSL